VTFLVHVGGQICLNPKRSWDWRYGETTFQDSREVNWYSLQENLVYYKYQGTAELYFPLPGSTPPDGLVLMQGEEEMNLLMAKHRRRDEMKTCHLYIIKKPCPGSYYYGYSSSEVDGTIPGDDY
jgi:hypothetical protein